MNRDRRGFIILVLVTVVQALAFYDHYAVSFAFFFGLGLGIWLRRWTAALYALASFVVAFAISAGTGWTVGARTWEAYFGAALALMGGLIGGGIFDLLRRERSEGEPVRTATGD